MTTKHGGSAKATVTKASHPSAEDRSEEETQAATEEAETRTEMGIPTLTPHQLLSKTSNKHPPSVGTIPRRPARARHHHGHRMPDQPRNKIWRAPVLWIASTILLLSLSCMSLSLLAFLGVLADVGPAENQ